MKKIYLLLLIILSFFLTPAQTVSDLYVDGKVYVKFSKAGLKEITGENPHNIPVSKLSILSLLRSKYGITKVTIPFYQANDDKDLPYILKIEFSKIHNINEFISDLSRLKGVLYAERVPLMKIDAVPNEGIPAHLSQINAANAWNVFNGNSNITVAIVDNAVMWTHIDLVQNTYTNTAEIAGNNIDDDANGYVDDVNGYDVSDLDNNTVPTNLGMNHGTHCAGIAAGRTDNNTGIASIGWNIKFIPVKCQTDNGSTTIVANGYEGILYAAKARARIISCSWGNAGSSATEQSVINYAWNRGSIVMASAGNNGTTTQNFPGAYNNVYCVAWVDGNDVKNGSSQYGSWVDISAPGTNINSTIPYTNTPAYLQQSGTSMATPLVAGLAGLMLSKSPHMTRTDVLNCISSTAVNIYTLVGNSSYATGNLLGAGRIEAYQAMLCAASFSVIAPVANFYAFPLNTCPNTPVQFYDSSLYNPTSWSWVFQGGSPATSTSSNPSVSWTTPGTYSVSLMVSNANGTNSKTKLSYITVAGPISLPFFEGFEASQFLPANWTPNNIWNDDIYWTRKINLGGFGTSTACAMFDNYNLNAADERDEMRSPKYNLSNVVSSRLRFDVAYARYNSTFSDTLEVKLSTNCGVSWTSIYLKGGTALSTAADQGAMFTPSSSQWRRDSIDVSSLVAGQGNVMFSFINRGNFGQPIYLDNINLTFPTPTLNTNFNSSVCVGSSVSFSNTSVNSFSYNWSFQNGSPGNTAALSPTITYSTPGTFTINLLGVNGTSTASISRTITVMPYPVLTINNPTICSGNSAVLTASGAISYSYYSGNTLLSTQPAYTFTPSSGSNFTIVGTNGTCASTQTAAVSVNTTPTISSVSQTICQGSAATFTASGATSYSWNSSPGSNTFVVSNSMPGFNIYTVTGMSNNCSNTTTVSLTTAPALTLNIVSTKSISCPSDPVVLSVSGAPNYSWSTGGINPTVTVTPAINTVYTVLGYNTVCSATAQTSISIVSAPNLSITASPAGSICAGSSVILTAGGAISYSWNTGSSSASLTVAPMINTSYTLTGSNTGCSRSQTILVSVFPALQPTVVSQLDPTCGNCSDGSISVTFTGGTSPFTFSWSPSGGNSLTASGLATGCYTIAITDVNGCNAFTSACVSSFVNIMEESVLNLKIYPNPAQNEITVEVPGKNFEVTIYNTLGQIIISQKNISEKETLNLENVAKGVYMLQVGEGFNQRSARIVVE